MLLWFFVIFLGIALGAGLYEARVVVPLWTNAPPGSLASPDSGRRFWAFVTTGPLTLLTIANLIAALQSDGPARTWWVAAAVVSLIERAATFGYFIPTIVRLQRWSTGGDAGLRAALARWVHLNYVRNVLVLLAWIAALKALST